MFLSSFFSSIGNPFSDSKGVQRTEPMLQLVPRKRQTSEETALQISSVMACTTLLAETVASMPIFVYRNDSGNRDLARETELWKLPPNPLLEAINEFLTEEMQEWEGTATELLKQLPDMQLSANVLSRRLNVVNSQLLNDYGIFYDNKRGHERKIILKRLEQKE